MELKNSILFQNIIVWTRRLIIKSFYLPMATTVLYGQNTGNTGQLIHFISKFPIRIQLKKSSTKCFFYSKKSFDTSVEKHQLFSSAKIRWQRIFSANCIRNSYQKNRYLCISFPYLLRNAHEMTFKIADQWSCILIMIHIGRTGQACNNLNMCQTSLSVVPLFILSWHKSE